MDIRDADEYQLNPYTPGSLGLFEHLHTGIDPRNQSDDFIRKFHYGTPHQIAYRHFAEGHKHVFKAVFEGISPGTEPFLIHCHAGKDRTGSMGAFILLLCGEPMENILRDFHASEMDTKEENLMAFLEVVNGYGGPEGFLLAAGVGAETVSSWKQNLLRHA